MEFIVLLISLIILCVISFRLKCIIDLLKNILNRIYYNNKE